jgi:hypothetical protein
VVVQSHNRLIVLGPSKKVLAYQKVMGTPQALAQNAFNSYSH